MKDGNHWWGILFCLFLGYAGYRLDAQPAFDVKTYSVKDGLSSNSLRRIINDKQGFLWISADNGLHRFDGNSFYIFRHNPADNRSLSSNNCDYLFIDREERFWIKTINGLSMYRPENQQFLNYYPDSSLVSGFSGGDIAQDEEGRLWLGGFGDLLIFDPASGQFTSSGWYNYAKKSGIITYEIRSNAVLELKKKSDHELWILSAYGLFSVDTHKKSFTHYPNPDIQDYWAFYLSHLDAKGKLWIGTYDKCFYTFDPAELKWMAHPCPEEENGLAAHILDIESFGKDSLLMISKNAIYLYQQDERSFSTYMKYDPQKYPDFPYGQNGSITRMGSRYFVIQNGETPLVQLSPKEDLIQGKSLAGLASYGNNHSFHTIGHKKIIVGDWTKESVLLCNEGGLDCHVLKDRQNKSRLGAFQYYFYLGGNEALFSLSKSVYRLNLVTYQIIRIELPGNVNITEETEFRNFVKDKHGRLYIRDRRAGIFEIDLSVNAMKPFFAPNNSNRFSELYYDKVTDKLWLAQERNGIFIVSVDKKSIKHYPLNLLPTRARATVSCIAGDDRGNVYLSVVEHGLMVIRSTTMQQRSYTLRDGLPSDNVFYGITDKNGVYWGTSEKGLFMLKKDRIRSFENLKKAAQFNYRLFFDADGQICQNLYPKMHIFFNPQRMGGVGTEGKVYIKSIRILDLEAAPDSILHLNYREHSLTLKFGYLDTEECSTPMLEYSINGSIWQKLDTDDEIKLNNLAPRTYRVEVRDSFTHGKRVILRILVAPPWWQKTWFILFFVLVVFLLAAVFYHKRVQSIRKEEQEKSLLHQRIAHTEMAALRAQMNPHFIFNCLNSINRFILVHDTEAASDYLTRFSRLIRLVLDSSREEFISLEKELEALRLYLGMEAMRFQDGFNWKIEIDPNVFTDQITIPPLLLQPYVENAIWHGLMQAPQDHGVKELLVHVFFVTDKCVHIEIIDNGIGRTKAGVLKSKGENSHKSYGISLTQERINLLYKTSGQPAEIFIEDLYHENQLPAGTKVTIKIHI
ncbi:MAG: histidine kinase [Saprospiraceae bacterium]|nr:histidine kinase [Saprospiraceae bacterium]